MQHCNILIVEDEPFLCDAYKLVIDSLNGDSLNYTFSVGVAHTFEEGSELVTDCINKQESQNLIALLDVRIVSNDGLFHKSGKDLAYRVRHELPKAKILIATSLQSKYQFFTIFTKINPDGFLIKSEIDFETIKEAIATIASGQTYYTKSISSYLRNNAAMTLPIDEFDRKLLYLLSQGYSIKEASNQLNLSISGIEWRQRKLAKIFNLENVRIHV